MTESAAVDQVTSCASMVETVKVTRRCWWGFDAARPLQIVDPLKAIIRFRISWTMAAGWYRMDDRMFLFGDLMGLPVGATPMLTPIYTLPYDGHPRACTAAMVYLIRSRDEVGADDVVARIAVRGEERHQPDAEFSCATGLSGLNIFPLPIEEEDECDDR